MRLIVSKLFTFSPSAALLKEFIQPVDKPPGLIGESGSDDMCVRTDENPKVFVLCGFRRPGAIARGEARKKSKKRRPTTFQQPHAYYIYRPDAVNTMLDMRA